MVVKRSCGAPGLGGDVGDLGVQITLLREHPSGSVFERGLGAGGLFHAFHRSTSLTGKLASNILNYNLLNLSPPRERGWIRRSSSPEPVRPGSRWQLSWPAEESSCGSSTKPSGARGVAPRGGLLQRR